MDGGVRQQQNLFPKGSQVEVTSDEEGFKGAWYEATVVEPPSLSDSKKKKKTQKKSNNIYVQYNNLLADEDESKPLKERVNLAFVRPPPPPPPSETDLVRSFELNDVVDAFYSDGWWTGVITRVLDDSRFVVTFRNPRDEIEFGISELRVHRKWVDGKWLAPEMKRTTGLMFSTGKKVEISFEKEDYRDVWFPATVLEDLGDGSFLVDYQSPGIGDEAGLLKVVVDSLHIRPSPPHLKNNNFVLLQKVDAFYDFGWWSGVITKELGDSCYVVFFKYTKKERELNHSELRPHMEWKDGKWFSASKDVFIPSDYQRHVGLVSDKAKSNDQAMMKKKTKKTTPDTDDTLSRPSKKLKEGNVAEAPSLTACQLNATPMDTPSNDTPRGFASRSNGKTGSSSSEQSMIGDQPSAKTDDLSSRKNVSNGKKGELDSHTKNPVRMRGRPPKPKIRSPQDSAGGKIGNAAGSTADDLVEKECVTKEIDIPVITGLENNGMRDSQANITKQFPDEESLMPTRNQEQQVDDPTMHKTNDGNQLAGGGEGSQKRRGRPPKLLGKKSKASVADMESTSVPKMPLAGKGEMPNEEGVQTSSKQQKYSSKKGKQRTISLNKESPIQDSDDVPAGKAAEVFEKDCLTKEVRTEDIDKLPSNTSDEQPQTWFGSMRYPTTVNGSSISVVTTVEECTEASAREKETIKQSPSGDAAVENPTLPFVKNAPLWKTIESMEVFQKMPQKPHFRTLGSCKASSREGLAIGSMINFSSVVENTSTLQFDDPRSIIEDNLETLHELESYGFDVEVVRDRLTSLLLIKDMQEEFEDRSKELKSRIAKQHHEKHKIDEEIDEIDKKIQKLLEKRALAVSKKEIKDSDIGSLETSVDDINVGINSARVEFEGVASAPW